MASKINPRKIATPLYIAMANSLHQRIDAGVYRADHKLPTEKELAEEFKVAIMTVRQGVGLLVQKGLVERRQGKGTFVRSVTDPRKNIALLFGPNLSDEPTHYYRAVLKRIQKEARENGWTYRDYDGLNDYSDLQPAFENLSNQQKEALISDSCHLPFSGIIELSPPPVSAIPAQLENLPKVQMSYSSLESDITVDFHHFGLVCSRQLARLGCKNLFFFNTQWSWESQDISEIGILEGAKEYGLPSPAIHVEHRKNQGYEMEKNFYLTFKNLLIKWTNSANKAHVPDGFIFNDDIALRSVAPALAEFRTLLPRPFKVATFGNEDVRFHYGFPTVRYELSPKRIAETLISTLEKRMAGIARTVKTKKIRGSLFLEK